MVPADYSHEAERLKALNAFGILDTAEDPEFDRLTELASLICEVPISLVSLIDDRRQWFKSHKGLDIRETPREYAFCQHAIQQPSIFEIEDATQDDRFSHNPLVTGDPDIRFYAGAPLIDPQGNALGTLCVIDRMPRKLNEQQQRALQLLASEAMQLIVEKRKKAELENFEKLFRLSNDLIVIAGIDGFFRRVNPSVEKVLGWDKDFLLSHSFMELIHPDDIAATQHELDKLAKGQPSIGFENRFRTSKGDYRILQWVATPEPSTGFLFATARDVSQEKEIQEKVRLSETNFRSFFELSQGLMCTHDLDGKFLSVNASGASLLGYTTEEMMSRTLFDIVPPKHHPSLRAYLSEIGSSGKSKGLMTTLHKDGSPRVWLFNNTVEKDGNGKPYVIGNSVDVTERMRLEKDLKYTKEILEQSNQLAMVGGWEMVAGKDEIFWSDVTRRIHEVPADYQPDLATALNFYKEGESRETITRVVTEALKNGGSWDVELQIVTAKGRERWVRARGAVDMEDGKWKRVYGVLQDIDEQKKTKLALEASENKYRAFFEISPVGIAINRHPDGAFIDGNAALYQMIGYTEEEYRKLSHWDVTPAKYDEQEMFHRNALTTIGRYGPYEKEYIHKDGHSVPVLLNGIRFTGINGQECVYSVIQDITESHKQRERLKAATLQSEQANIAKSEFLASMSHEIRTPLNGVIGFTDLVLKTDLDETQQQYLNIVNQSANTLLSTINDILDFSKIEAGKLDLEIEKHDLFELGGEAADIISYQVRKKNLAMHLNIAVDLPRFVWTDSVRLKQVLLNLLSNACKFTEKGTIELKIEALSALKDDHITMRFEVRDTGIGIPPEKQHKIFEAFSQADGSITRKYGGTGLGLTISNKLLALMGSTLQLKSKAGKGSSFYFDLRLKAVNGSHTDRGQHQHIRKVLIVDDNENDSRILKEMLRLENIESEVAATGEAALQLLEDGQEYDLALIDYQMPDLDGIATTERIRDNYFPSADMLPVIILSSGADEQYLETACSTLDVSARLTKPVRMQHLLRAMSRIVRPDTTQTDLKAATSLLEQPFRLLIAEDGQINMVLAKTIIKKIAPNAQVFTAQNGHEAISQFENSKPNIVFMDIQMPGLNGYEATARIRSLENGKHVPIIAITAGNMKGEREKCVEAGMDDFMAKPIVQQMVHDLLVKWLAPSVAEQQRATVPTPAATTDAIIDFTWLKDASDNDPDVFALLLDMLVQELTTAGSNLAEAAAQRDHARLHAVAHKLKGTALTSGIAALGNTAAAIEADAEQQSDATLPLVDQAATQIRQALEVIRAKQAEG
jgi:PAS domain S-box-containing protein